MFQGSGYRIYQYFTLFFLKILYLLERWDRREKGHQLVACGTHPNLDRTPTWDGTHISGMCPDQESNQRPFTLGDNAQPAESHWSGQHFIPFCCQMILHFMGLPHFVYPSLVGWKQHVGCMHILAIERNAAMSVFV